LRYLRSPIVTVLQYVCEVDLARYHSRSLISAAEELSCLDLYLSGRVGFDPVYPLMIAGGESISAMEETGMV
jgi:hypothetical protein